VFFAPFQNFPKTATEHVSGNGSQRSRHKKPQRNKSKIHKQTLNSPAFQHHFGGRCNVSVQIVFPKPAAADASAPGCVEIPVPLQSPSPTRVPALLSPNQLPVPPAGLGLLLKTDRLPV